MTYDLARWRLSVRELLLLPLVAGLPKVVGRFAHRACLSSVSTPHLGELAVTASKPTPCHLLRRSLAARCCKRRTRIPARCVDPSVDVATTCSLGGMDGSLASASTPPTIALMPFDRSRSVGVTSVSRFSGPASEDRGRYASKSLTCRTRRSISNGFGKKASTPRSSGWRLG